MDIGAFATAPRFSPSRSRPSVGLIRTGLVPAVTAGSLPAPRQASGILLMTSTVPVSAPPRAADALYRAVWRWHFYAGLLTVPFLVILAVTGSIYLFDDELNDAIYADLRRVPASATQGSGPAELLRRAEAAYPDATATRIDLPAARDRSAVVFMSVGDGHDLRVHVDPHDGRVLGAYDFGWSLVGLADVMHGSLLLGTFGDRVVELAACWAFVLVVTGLYLWWPRHGAGYGGTLVPRLRRRGRPLWRDLHAVTGVYAAAGITFLVLTGLPWAGLWGDLLTRATNGIGAGYPTGLWEDVPTSGGMTKDVVDGLPWTLEGAPIPVSVVADAGHDGHGAPSPGGGSSAAIDIDAVSAIARAHGLHGGYRLTLPDEPTGVYTVGYFPDQPEGQRTLHIDQYSGRVLVDYRFADYGAVAKPVEWGIALHMGDYFGLANQLLMLSIAIMIAVLAVTGTVMWWKRRPQGRLGAPPAVALPRLRTVALITLGLGIVFPLLGLSLLTVLTLDQLVLRRVPRLRAAFG